MGSVILTAALGEEYRAETTEIACPSDQAGPLSGQSVSGQ